MKTLKNIWPQLVAAVLFVAICLFLLAGSNYDYLRKVEQLSYCSASQFFIDQLMKRPGGLLMLCGSWLTQLFYHPWLGSVVMTVVAMGLWALLAKAAKLPGRMWLLGAVSPLMLVAALVSVGYGIYVHKTPGFAYVGLLGMAAAAAIAWMYSAISKAWLRLVVVLATVIAGYPLMGFYALYAAVLCIIVEIAGRRHWWLMTVTAAVSAGWPGLYFYIVPSHAMLSRLYVAALPEMAATETALNASYAIALAWGVLLMCARSRWAAQPKKPVVGVAVSCTVFVAALVCAWCLRYDDANFNTAVKMDMAIEDGRYGDAVRAAMANPEEPTRLVCLLGHVALLHEGQAGDSLFALPTGGAPYNAARVDLALRQAFSRGANMRFGRVNEAYRWCMEDMVEYGPKVEYLSLMARCALLNGEYELARRYATALQGTMYHKDEAAKYMAMADDPKLIREDPQLDMISRLYTFPDMICGDGSLVETFLTRLMSLATTGTMELSEASLQFNLIQKTIPGFWPRFQFYVSNNERIPRHYQEAALLFAALEHNVDLSAVNIDPAIKTRFDAFMRLARQNARFSEEQNREIFKETYGDTYWYYYFFIKGIKTT